MKKNESLYVINKDKIKLTVDRIIYNKKYYMIIKLSEFNIEKGKNVKISFKTINSKTYTINLTNTINEINNHLFRQSDELLLLSDIYVSGGSNIHTKVYLNQDNYEISLKLFNKDVLLSDTMHIDPNINIKDFIN